MSDTRFTKGPWSLHSTVYKLNEDRRPANIFWATVYAGNRYGTVRTEDSEIAANTALISAAPELYEALGSLIERYTSLVKASSNCRRDPEADEQVIAARTALAKARGETP